MLPGSSYVRILHYKNKSDSLVKFFLSFAISEGENIQKSAVGIFCKKFSELFIKINFFVIPPCKIPRFPFYR